MVDQLPPYPYAPGDPEYIDCTLLWHSGINHHPNPPLQPPTPALESTTCAPQKQGTLFLFFVGGGRGGGRHQFSIC